MDTKRELIAKGIGPDYDYPGLNVEVSPPEETFPIAQIHIVDGATGESLVGLDARFSLELAEALRLAWHAAELYKL